MVLEERGSLRNEIVNDHATQDHLYDQPSSKFVPTINGIFANSPLANNEEGNSGMNPPGPSIVGSQGNISGASF
jgi:hypothetical protein